MFNLLVGLPDGGVLQADRLLEGLNTEERARLGVSGKDFSSLHGLPTLALPEVAPGETGVFAQAGALDWITQEPGDSFRLSFTPHRDIDPIPAEKILANLHRFGLSGDWALHRTRLLVKNGDLYRTLLELEGDGESVRPSRRLLNFPDGPVQDDLVVVMMPFDDHLKPVWEKIQRIVLDEDLQCLRAKDIWQQSAIMDDVVSLLWRARIVISDYTDRNTNVFYETGIAHTLGRECIALAQDLSDVPFDLRHLRALEYKQTPVGLDRMGLDLAQRIRTILQSR